ncbi:class I SAM-dependent methyltransferase [Falsirhodobacter sp. alg1]|uniref:class I SAM-dependent methyltransferase n=1 Tax=Falsirhodobacter sp. alg1 TaxID=1472418 RepID=UPI0005ED7CFF|nr:methyltransferase [Falsirhodobacter sp. alg1]
MRAARLGLALDTGALTLPEGRIAILGPHAGDDISALPKDRTVVVQGFRPDHDHFAAQGWQTAVVPPADATTMIVCLPRAKAHAQAMLSVAAKVGVSVVDGQKTDGIDSVLRDLRARGTVGEAVTKAHGKLAVFEADLDEWAAAPRMVEGFQTVPGVFSADGPDRGSVLLADLLGPLKGRVADLGAGWGYLSRAALAKGAAELDLVEADAAALECARINVPGENVRFHWADATTWTPDRSLRHVVCNPPFHTGRDADPALGIAFITQAARILASEGTLWLVANRHLPYREVLQAAFRKVEEIGGDGAFRVVRAEGPNRRR